jgi:hypothetical protein
MTFEFDPNTFEFDPNAVSDRHLDINGKPISFNEWAILRDDINYWKIGRDEISDDVMVSTVWLGINLGIGGEVTIFETMIFGGPLDQEQWRYATLKEAKKGHRHAVEAARHA